MKLDPKTVVWEYTLKCDSKCIHCGSNAKLPRKDELTTKESLDLVNQISNIGFNFVILSGGEPTLRKDWPRIAEEIKKENMRLGIISNTLAWNSKTFEKLYSLNPFSTGFSVDGEKELHDYLRGIKGSHEKTFDSIKKLKRKDLTVCAITSVNKKNLKELKKIRNRLIVYDVDAWQIQVASPMGRMAQNKELILDEEEHYELGKFISETREKLHYMNVQAADCLGYFGRLGKRIRANEWGGCMAGIQGLGIESNGNVKGCLSIRADQAIEGNLRKEKLRDIWENSENFKYNRQFNIMELKGNCKGCDHGLKCKGGCGSQSTAFFNEFHNSPYCFLIYETQNKKGRKK